MKSLKLTLSWIAILFASAMTAQEFPTPGNFIEQAWYEWNPQTSDWDSLRLTTVEFGNLYREEIHHSKPNSEWVPTYGEVRFGSGNQPDSVIDYLVDQNGSKNPHKKTVYEYTNNELTRRSTFNASVTTSPWTHTKEETWDFGSNDKLKLSKVYFLNFVTEILELQDSVVSYYSNGDQLDSTTTFYISNLAPPRRGWRMEFTYDNDGWLLTESRNSGNVSEPAYSRLVYGYDELDRIVTKTTQELENGTYFPVSDERFEYDRNSDRITKIAHWWNEGGTLIQTSELQFFYNGAGDLESYDQFGLVDGEFNEGYNRFTYVYYPLGLNDVDGSGSVSVTVYPNPAAELVHFLAPSLIESIRIYNLHGEMVHEEANFNDTKAMLSMAELAQGSYFYKVQLSNGHAVTGQLIH